MRTCVRVDRLRPAAPLRARRRRRRTRGAAERGPAALAPEPGRERSSWGRSRRAAEGLRRPSRACGWARRSRAARGWRSSRPTRSGWPTPGSGCSPGWRRVGARVEPERPGLACFDARGLAACTAARSTASLRAPTRAPRRRIRRARALGCRRRRGPLRARAPRAARPAPRRPRRFVAGAADLAGEPVALLRHRQETAALPRAARAPGDRRRSGALAALPRAAVADRFGRAGLLAHDLAHGRDTAAAPAPPGERARGGPRARGVRLRRAARARARAAGRPAAGPPRARRAHAARRRPRRGARRGRHVARARRLPRAAGRPRPDARSPSASGSRSCPRPPSACGWRSSASARRHAAGRALFDDGRRAAPPRACARPSARRAPSPARRRRCACSPSIRTRACPSAARS